MPNVSVPSIPEFIRKTRLKLKMSQEDLARKAKVTRAFVTLIEGGKREPSLNVLLKVFDALEIEWGLRKKKMKKSARRSIPT